MMNQAVVTFDAPGSVLDVGSGKKPEYHALFRSIGAPVFLLDFKLPDGRSIDLEKDALPHADASMHSVLLFNVLEHLYDYRHTLREIHRVLA